MKMKALALLTVATTWPLLAQGQPSGKEICERLPEQRYEIIAEQQALTPKMIDLTERILSMDRERLRRSGMIVGNILEMEDDLDAWLRRVEGKPGLDDLREIAAELLDSMRRARLLVVQHDVLDGLAEICAQARREEFLYGR